MMTESIINKLESLGISEKEARAYMALLKSKSATVIQVSKATNLKRTTVYHCLEGLIQKGLVTKMTRDDKRTYVAQDPKESFANLLREKKSVIDLAVPVLKDVYGKGTNQPEIKIYQNVSGLRKIFEDMLACKEKTVRYFVSSGILEELMGKEFVDSFVEKRIANGITSLSLRAYRSYHPEREEDVTHASQLRKVKFLPEGYMVNSYMVAYDNKVVFIARDGEKVGFIIESKDFAEAQKTIFDMLWNTVAI